MGQFKQHKTVVISADSETLLLNATKSTLLIDIIDISLSAGNVSIHKTATETTTNQIFHSETPGKVGYPALKLELGDDLYMLPAGIAAGRVTLTYEVT